jgi:tetratricopeptide (TPR) repeat protein
MATSFSDYLRLYKASWLKLQESSPQLNSYNRSLHTTWQVSIDRIEQQNHLSAMLLRLWAYFDRQDIWFELLQRGESADFDWLRELTDELNFNGAVRLLCSYGLVDAEPFLHNQVESGGYSMHACVHAWTVSVLNKRWDKAMARLALKCTATAVPNTNTDKWWLLQRRVLQHAARCQSFIASGEVEIEGMEWALGSLGNLYAGQGKLGEAEGMYLQALQGKEPTLGPTHTSTLNTVNNLGLLYIGQGKLGEAETMYIRALQGYEEALGPTHTLILNTVINLGVLYTNQGKLGEAETMYLRALQGYEETLGPTHTSTLYSLHCLANLRSAQGRYPLAEKFYRSVLHGYEDALGSKHTRTLMAVNNLGMLYASQSKLGDAEAMYIRALKGREEALGPKHTATLDTVNNLGSVLCKHCISVSFVKTLDDGQQVRAVLDPSTVLTYFHRLVWLCANYYEARRSLLGGLGRVLMWMDNAQERSLQAFFHQLAITKPLHYAICDSCNQGLDDGSGRLVCMVCEDIDLCAKCHTRFTNKEPLAGVQSCYGHAFLDLSTNEAELMLEPVENWLASLAKTKLDNGDYIE